MEPGLRGPFKRKMVQTRTPQTSDCMLIGGPGTLFGTKRGGIRTPERHSGCEPNIPKIARLPPRGAAAVAGQLLAGALRSEWQAPGRQRSGALIQRTSKWSFNHGKGTNPSYPSDHNEITHLTFGQNPSPESTEAWLLTMVAGRPTRGGEITYLTLGHNFLDQNTNCFNLMVL